MDKSKDYQTLLVKAIEFHKNGNLQEAFNHYTDLLDKGFIDPSLFSNLGLLKESLNELDEAKYLYNKAINLFPNNIEGYLNLGTLYDKLGAKDKAIETYHKATKLEPKSAIAYSNLGILLNKYENPREAVDYLKQAVSINPYFADAHFNLGCTYESLEFYKEAESSYLKAIEINPKMIVALSNLGLLMRREGRLDEGINYLEKAVALSQPNPNLYNDLSVIYLEKEEFKDALIHIQKAIELNPRSPTFYSNLGNIYIELGDLEKARITLDKALNIDKNCVNALVSLSEIDLKNKNLKQSRIRLNQALEINPLLARAYYNLSKFNHLSDSKFTKKNLFSSEIIKKLNTIDKIDIYHARANFLDRNKQYIESTKMITEANRLTNKIYGSNYNHLKTNIAYHRKHYKKVISQELSYKNDQNFIFIVGMPRSGKTIVESILSCNPAIHCIGESKAMEKSIQQLIHENNKVNNLQYLYINSLLNQKNFHKYICDTNPFNFIFTGYILNQIKKAKIIFCQRNMLDIAKELYFKNLGAKYTFKTSIESSKNIILLIENLMLDYKNIFPSKIYFLKYEDLVTKKDETIQALLNWLGLEYNSNYLSPIISPTTNIFFQPEDNYLNSNHINCWQKYSTLFE